MSEPNELGFRVLVHLAKVYVQLLFPSAVAFVENLYMAFILLGSFS